MNAFVTADSNWGISYKDSPLATIPSEKKERLKEVTGKVVVYGVKYLKELPGNLPIRGSINMIFTDGVKSNLKTSSEVFSFDTIEELRKALKDYPDEDIYIIDNEKLYREFLPDINVVHVTKIDYEYKADAFFDNLDKNPDFVITADSDEQYCFDIVYEFLRYERK
ncbi:MAG: dihydrofolate reductase [Lachnospiraceae bacterium]|nr:dihydrofolate reductase [Lachnospiraceae bacterium]